MILTDYVLPRWICPIPWLVLLLLDELIRTVCGWPVYPIHYPSTSSDEFTSSNSVAEKPPGSEGSMATLLWPFFANQSDPGVNSVSVIANSTAAHSTNTSEALERWNDTGNGHGTGGGDSFVEDHAGVWVIGVMSGTCILTIAFIVRALFSRAEAFRDPQENMFAQDGIDDQMGLGFGGTAGGLSGTDFGHL